VRVQSKFRDYYDVVQSTGQDQTLVYRRYKSEVPGDKYNIPFMSSKGHHGGGMWYYQRMVGFCGKLYPVFEMNLADHCSQMFKSDRVTKTCCYSLDDIDRWVRKNFDEEDVARYESADRTKRLNAWPQDHRRGSFQRFFQQWEEYKGKDWRPIFEENNCPLFTTEAYEKYDRKRQRYYNVMILHLNTRLKDVEFFKVFDPYMAYQEISMFLGSMAEPRKGIPEVSDADLLEAKGFDPRFSFRKDPGEKKKNKKKV
jgi:hypothetical protein